MIPVILKNSSSKKKRTKPFNKVVNYVVGQQNVGDFIAESATQKFNTILNYATAHHDKSKQQKCTAVRCHGVTDIRTASLEMNAVSSRNTRCISPVFHFVLSWHENENVTNETMFDAATHALKKLGLSEHQSLCTIHADTDNWHCHVVVNRIHPITFKSKNIEWANKTLHFAARESEIKHSWIHDNGIYIVKAVKGSKVIVLNPEHNPQDKPSQRKVNDVVPTWTDPDGLKHWIKSTVAQSLKSVLADFKSWDDLHDWLAQYGLRLSNSGGGGLKIHAESPETGEKINIAVSKVLRIVNRETLEKRFGKFIVARIGSNNHVVNHVPERKSFDDLKPASWDEAGNDQVDSESQQSSRTRLREERAAARLDLRKRYAQYIRSVTEKDHYYSMRFQELRTAHRLEIKELTENKKTLKKAIHQIEDDQDRLVVSLTLAAEFFQRKAALNAKYSIARAAISKTKPPNLNWRVWLIEQSRLGDLAAISALRGIVYQAKRDANRLTLDQGVKINAEHAFKNHEDRESQYQRIVERLLESDLAEIAIRPTNRNLMRQHECGVLLAQYANIQWHVTGNGNIDYFGRGGDHLFTDRGNRITFDRSYVSDADIRTALIHASQKFGNRLLLTGSDQAFVIRMACIADDLGLTILNPELQSILEQRNAERYRQAEQKNVNSIDRSIKLDTSQIAGSTLNDRAIDDNKYEVPVADKTLEIDLPIQKELISGARDFEAQPLVGGANSTSSGEIEPEPTSNIVLPPPPLSAKVWLTHWSQKEGKAVVEAHPGNSKVEFTVMYIAEDGVVLNLGRTTALYPAPENSQLQVGDRVTVDNQANLCYSNEKIQQSKLNGLSK